MRSCFKFIIQLIYKINHYKCFKINLIAELMDNKDLDEYIK
jgi:hypothetical protein